MSVPESAAAKDRAMQDWSARQYLKFEDERTRAARDLLARVPLQQPRRVVDLGCGPGNSTALLVERFPGAEVVGLDSSADMLRSARTRLPNCGFVAADIVGWAPDERTDLIFANAVFQWVPDHPHVLRRLLQALPAGGVLAVQMPDNAREPANAAQREVAVSGPWAADLAVAEPRDAPLAAEAYYDLLTPVSQRIDIWRCIYHHALASPQAIVEWFKGSSLQPYLALLGPGDREQFLTAYTERIAAAYKTRADGKVLLPFPRLFMVAVR
jgi:trans-aconitate 2-methyltransferase